MYLRAAIMISCNADVALRLAHFAFIVFPEYQKRRTPFYWLPVKASRIVAKVWFLTQKCRKILGKNLLAGQ